MDSQSAACNCGGNHSAIVGFDGPGNGHAVTCPVDAEHPAAQSYDEGDRMLRHVAALHGMPVPGSNEWSEAEEVTRWRTEAEMYGRLFGEYRRALHDLLTVVDDWDSSDRRYAIHMARSLDARYGRPE